MLTDIVKNKIYNIIQINLDATEGYRDAAAAVSDADLQTVFNKCSVDRQMNVDKLTAQVNWHGADPETTGSLKASLHRTWMTFKADIVSNNEVTVVEECIRGDEAAIEVYNEAIAEAALNADIRALITKQYVAIQNNLNQLREWKTLLEKNIIVS